MNKSKYEYDIFVEPLDEPLPPVWYFRAEPYIYEITDKRKRVYPYFSEILGKTKEQTYQRAKVAIEEWIAKQQQTA